MRWFKVAAILLGATLMASSSLAQDDVSAQAYRTVNVRSGPGTQYDIIGQLNRGSEVTITGRSDEESDWLRIDFSGRDGWVAYFTVTVLGDTDTLDVIEPPPVNEGTLAAPTPTPLHADGAVYVMTFRRVNVRSGPGMDYARVGDLESGSSADVTGRSEDNQWLQISFDGQPGWVAYFVVSLSGALDTIAIIDAPGAALTATPLATVQLVTRYNVNLRAEPDFSSPIIDVVPFNTQLQADAQSDGSGSWLRVTYQGQTGWLVSSLVDLAGERSDLAIVQPSARARR